MRPSGNIARLVRAFVFQLIAGDGSVRAQLDTNPALAALIGTNLKMFHDHPSLYSELAWSNDDTDFVTYMAQPSGSTAGQAWWYAEGLDYSSGAGRYNRAQVSAQTQSIGKSASSVVRAWADKLSGNAFSGIDLQAFGPSLNNASLQIEADSGTGTTIYADALDVQLGDLSGSGGTMTLETSTGEVRDQDDRQFVRSDDGRTKSILLMADTTTDNTDGSGDISVSFPEAFSGVPEVVPVQHSTVGRYVNVVPGTVTTSGFDVRCRQSGGAVLGSGVSVTFSWIAYGFKDVI